MISTKEVMIFKGVWWDEFLYKSGKHLVSEVKNNAVMITGQRLCAALFKNDIVADGVGIAYHALGQGLPAWENLLDVPANTEVALKDEQFRKVPTDISYVEPGTNNLTLNVTNVIRIKTEYDFTDGPDGFYIREQGLFGGVSALPAKDSGFMINNIRHRGIYKDSNLKLVRYIQISF